MLQFRFTLICFFVTIISHAQVTATYEQVLNKEVKGRVDEYITEAGESLKEGDTLTLGTAFRNEQYDYIVQNAGIATYPLNNTASNSKVQIKKLMARNKLMYVFTTKPQGAAYGLFVTNIESALQNGEVQSSIMSSDEALKELKKWKSKLDLELISQEEYDAKKAELAKYIK